MWAGAWVLFLLGLVLPSARGATPPPPPLLQKRAASCVRDRSIAFVGDSVVRGIYFDVVALLNGSRPLALRAAPHPGHNASYDADCLQFKSRGAYNLSRCVLWDHAICGERRKAMAGAVRPLPGLEPFAVAGSPAPCGAVRPRAVQPSTCRTRLTFFNKAFAADPCVDASIMAVLSKGPAPPAVLVLGLGLWDMLYTKRPKAFAEGLRAFLLAVRRVPFTGRILWLTVTAMVEDKLPVFKRQVMTTAMAARLNAVARPIAAEVGADVVDLFGISLEHPSLSVDGVHYPALLELAEEVLGALC